MHVPVMVSDEGLRTAILEALATNGQTSRLNLRVGVLNGIAHLAGSAGTMAERAVAEEIARGVEGVRGVVNRIEAPGAPSPARTVNLNLSSPK